MSSIRKRVDSFVRAIQPPIKPADLLQKPTPLALPLFTFGSVMLAYLVGSKSAFLSYLSQVWTIYLGLGGMTIALLLHRLPRLHYSYSPRLHAYLVFLLATGIPTRCPGVLLLSDLFYPARSRRYLLGKWQR
jgi:hypothetical protein